MIEAAINYAFLTPEGGWRVTGSRVSLDSVVHCYWEGLSPESIVNEFPTLNAEQVYGAIAFYLHNRTEIDKYLQDQEVRWQELKERSERDNSVLLARLRAARDAKNLASNS
ncbi:MAG: DUF433 domain-containing protein [Pirellulales bacterium]